MNHLEEAKQQLEYVEDAPNQELQMLYIQDAQAHALIAIAEQLERMNDLKEKEE